MGWFFNIIVNDSVFDIFYTFVFQRKKPINYVRQVASSMAVIPFLGFAIVLVTCILYAIYESLYMFGSILMEIFGE